MATRRRATTVPAHPFVVDELTPADPYTELAVCATCHKPGHAGDAQHPTTPAPIPTLPASVAAEYRARDAAILGETHDD